MIQLDISNKQQIQQIDLKNLVSEDPNTTIVKFLVDETYKRYIFCFLGQKKAYVWNYSQQLQEQYLFLPSIRVKKLKIEQNYILISCAFQINIFYLDTPIRFFTVIKKNFIQDKIIDFSFISDKVIAIFFIDKFELFLIQGENVNLVSQQDYSYPKILDYHLDSLSNSVKIIGMHQNGIFENNYNLDTFSYDQISECTLLISNSQIAQVQNNLNSVYPKQIKSQSINGIFLIDQQNYQSYVYLQVTVNDLQKTIQYISQYQNRQFVVSSYNIQNSFILLSNNTFSSLNLPIFQLANFNLDFENNTNLNININQNQNTQQIIFQNITINFQCFSIRPQRVFR
ncbi:hypothetical protein TTHERM_000748978 (macronuclear) [Tetrahymena thermophila SB210]|uniref:Uncharacterized protein n=1 Tax=Tetrahymena thermophila (strain SB210) TaxID=312017 RepID=W7XIX4_TETTS|nr:hypothetical protein TTHERM_000748978 [Tetrahymena thermophila SB210]EWS75011.1 hypothetical protein TTHERM_000748978 [Tetrahymena thermophila SB210]|eukprot:XP_012652469.1 hypothetical protein TTHERM_000748978 [Tetrahymena thermophila SB210]